jgi:hypothetical protein
LGVELGAGAEDGEEAVALEELSDDDFGEGSAAFPPSLLSDGFDSPDESDEVLSELFGA